MMVSTRDAEKNPKTLSTEYQDKRRAYHALNQIGGRNIGVVGVVVALGLVLAVVSEAVTTLLAELVEGVLTLLTPLGENGPLSAATVAQVVLLVAAAGLLWFSIRHLLAKARDADEEMRPRISKEDPEPAKVLIIFVSMPNKPWIEKTGIAPVKVIEETRARVHDYLMNLDEGDLTNPAWRAQEKFKEHNWRMTCEAVAYHLQHPRSQLKHVLLVGSSDREKPPVVHDSSQEPAPKVQPQKPEITPGSHNYDDLLKDFLIKKLEKPEWQKRDITVSTLGETDLFGSTYRPSDERPAIDLKQGIDFENLELVTWILHDLYRNIKKKHDCREADILCDITGGQKINSMAGAIFAVLVPKRRFQYVSTTDYQVYSYDATLEPDTA